MTRGTHQAITTPAPVCPGCGRPMQSGPAGVYGCDHIDTPVPTHDLPRGTP